MSQLPDFWSILRWLVSEDTGAPVVLSPTEVMELTLAVFALIGVALFIVAWRNKIRRDERTRQMTEYERTVSRMRRM